MSVLWTDREPKRGRPVQDLCRVGVLLVLYAALAFVAVTAMRGM